jgi:Domain of unknown function (DUF1772)
VGAELPARDVVAGAAGRGEPALRCRGVVGAVVPFTFAAIMPTNHRLLAPDRDLASAETRALLVRWGRLHAVRTVMGLASAAIDIWLMQGA